MDEQVYQKDDRVRCVNYGHISIQNNKKIDLKPELVGQEGTVNGSYTDFYGGKNGLNSYSIKWDLNGTISWFGLQQLEKVK